MASVWHSIDLVRRFGHIVVAGIVYTITTLVPINNRIASWEKSTPPADWKTYRSKWDTHHRWRVALLTIAFAILVAGIL